MKKVLCIVLAVILTCGTIAAADSYIEVTEANCIVYYNNRLMKFSDQDGNWLPALEYNNNIYVPVRSYNEQIGNNVEWSPNTHNVLIDNSKQQENFGEVFGKTNGTLGIVDVSIINLIAMPEIYNGKNVRVHGVLNIEFETEYLFLTADDRRFLNIQNAIGLTIYGDKSTLEALGGDYDRLCMISGSYCTIEGVFWHSEDGDSRIVDINLIECDLALY